MKGFVFIIMMMATLQMFGQQEKVVISEKMDYFSFMEGEWEGIGYYTRQDGWVDTVYQHEEVVYKLSGSLLTIEGTGKNKIGEIVFNAFATIYFDLKEKSYRMQAFKDDGAMTLANIDIIDPQHFIWSFSPNAYANVKYELQISDNGAWTEKGYFSSDKENWIPFFQMELNKLKD